MASVMCRSSRGLRARRSQSELEKRCDRAIVTHAMRSHSSDARKARRRRILLLTNRSQGALAPRRSRATNQDAKPRPDGKRSRTICSVCRRRDAETIQLCGKSSALSRLAALSSSGNAIVSPVLSQCVRTASRPSLHSVLSSTQTSDARPVGRDRLISTSDLPACQAPSAAQR